MKKAPIAVALVLVFGLFAVAFSLAPAVAQQMPPTNATGTGNTTSTANATSTNTTTTSTNATGGETFSARGSIATLIFDTGETTTTSETQNDTMTASNDTSLTGNMTTAGNTTTSTGNDTTMTMPQIMTGDNGTSSSNMTGTESNMTSTSNETSTAEEMQTPYILAGDWRLDVQDGSVSEFAANFTMVHTDGTERHAHEMSNFVSSDSSTIDTSGEGSSFIFGTVDVATNGETAWPAADALIIIDKNNVVTISLATEDTEDHFAGQPIYGIVESMTDEAGNEMIDTGTETAGGTMGNMTQSTGGANETGQSSDNTTEGIEGLFNSTG